MNDKKACDVLAYAAASSKEMYDDPGVYAAHRLLSTMERFLGFLQEEGYDDPFYEELRAYINANHELVIIDFEQFGKIIDEVVKKVAIKSFEYS